MKYVQYIDDLSGSLVGETCTILIKDNNNRTKWCESDARTRHWQFYNKNNKKKNVNVVVVDVVLVLVILVAAAAVFICLFLQWIINNVVVVVVF